MRSSWTLWSPEGRDLNSTLSESSTKSVFSYALCVWRRTRFETDAQGWHASMLSYIYPYLSHRCVRKPLKRPFPYPALTSNKMRKTAATGGTSSNCPTGRSRCSECPRRLLAVDILTHHHWILDVRENEVDWWRCRALLNRFTLRFFFAADFSARLIIG